MCCYLCAPVGTCVCLSVCLWHRSLQSGPRTSTGLSRASTEPRQTSQQLGLTRAFEALHLSCRHDTSFLFLFFGLPGGPTSPVDTTQVFFFVFERLPGVATACGHNTRLCSSGCTQLPARVPLWPDMQGIEGFGWPLLGLLIIHFDR